MNLPQYKKWRVLLHRVIAKEQAKREQTHPVCLHAVEKFEKVGNANTQWLWNNEFKIVQKNSLEIKNNIKKKDFFEKPLITMIITWQIRAVKGQRLAVIDRWLALSCSAGLVETDFLASENVFFCSEIFLLVKTITDISGGEFLKKDHILTNKKIDFLASGNHFLPFSLLSEKREENAFH